MTIRDRSANFIASIIGEITGIYRAGSESE